MLNRNDILRWIGESVEVPTRKMQYPVKRVEDLGDGVCYCLLVNHFCGPRVLSDAAVNKFPKSESDLLGNYRQLQAAFTRLKLFRHIDVEYSN